MTTADAAIETAAEDAPAWARPGAADLGDSFETMSFATKSSYFSATDKARELIDEGKEQIAKTFDGLVQAAHEFADRMEGGAGGPVAHYARQAAEMIGGWQALVREKSVEELLDEGRDLVRRSPVAAVGVAVAAGFVLSRFLKSAR